MPSRAALLLAVGTVTALLAVPSQPGAAEARTLAEDPPLQVTIDTLTPSVVPESGPLEVTGWVTNVSDEAWRTITVYGLTSQLPISNGDALQEAAETDPDVQVGDRITAEGTFDNIGTLAPGDIVRYSLRIPRRVLAISGRPGIYWFAVHALGETDNGRDTLADGKARTFLPLVDDAALNDPGLIDTALVVSVRRSVRHATDGRLSRITSWTRDLGPAGRLDSLTDFVAAAGPRPVTWLVDPAVTDSAARLAAGNPPRDLGPSAGLEPGEDPSVSGSGAADPSASPSESPPTDEEEDGEDEQATAAGRAAARAAESWLASTRQAMVGDEVLALPYGDPDLPGAADTDPGLLQIAQRRARRELPALRVPTRPVVASPDGFLDEAAVGLVPPRTTVLVSDQMLGGDAPSLAEVYGRRVVVASSRAVSGGPGPDDPLAPVAARQRLLSEAALALLAGRDSLVVEFPSSFDFVMPPGAATEFFEGLDVGWLRLSSMRFLAAQTEDLDRSAEASYPDRVADRELPALNFAAARALMGAGSRLDGLLPQNDTVAGEVTDEALTGVSYAMRDHPGVGIGGARRSTAELEDLTSRVTVEPPISVTLSSETGAFSATVINGLDEVVLVRVAARTDPGLEIPTSEPVELGPDEQATVRMEATSSVLGVHEVDLVITDAEGRAVGATASFPLRAAQVSQLIWIAWGVGGALLFGAITVRLYRRVRGHLATRPAPSGRAEP